MVERLADIEGLKRDTRHCENEKLAVDRETSRIEKACGVLSRALDRGASAVAQAFTRLIRTNDLRQSTWTPEQKSAAAAKRDQAIAELKPRTAKNKLDAAIAQVEYKIEKLKTAIRFGFAPRKGRIEELRDQKSKLESRTPEAIATDRNYLAERRIISLCANIHECRGPRKEQIKAKLAKIAKDESLGQRVRSTAKRRIAWIDAGAPAGAPAGSSNNPMNRNPSAMQQGGEARERSIGGDAR